MKRLSLAIDCDDVLTPTAEWVIETYNSVYGAAVTLKDFYSTDPKIWKASTHEEAAARVGALLKLPEYARLRPFDDATRVIPKLAEVHALHLVTGRAVYLEPITLTMLDTYFPLCFQSINHTGYFEGEKKGKGEICAELGIDVLVDDHMVHLNDVREIGLKEVILFGNYPWNQIGLLPFGVERCVTWGDVEREVERIAGK